jgi:hypothetical protein
MKNSFVHVRLVGLALIGLAGMLVATSAGAQALDPFSPASVLIFPVVDARSGQGTGTVISVTNTNDNMFVSPTNNFRTGDVRVHFHYVDAHTSWRIFDRVEELTPNDTLTVLAGDHFVDNGNGYLYCIAEDMETGDPINFNYLIGDEVVVNVSQNYLAGINAIGIQALATGSDRTNTGHARTDSSTNGGDGDGRIDFDGHEYALWPDQLFIASFLEQSANVRSTLYLLSTLGGDWETRVAFLFFNNEETSFSRDFRFHCWTEATLESISGVTANLNGSSTEIACGWASLSGDNAVHVLTGQVDHAPPLLGALITQVSTPFTYGHLLHMTGTRDGGSLGY